MEAAAKLDVSVVTLRRWDKAGKLSSAFPTFGGHRRFSASDVLNVISDKQRVNICYARVSSHDQKKDLDTQADFLGRHCDKNDIQYEVSKDLGSGLNVKKKGLNK